MRLHHGDEAVTLWHGDCLDVLRQLPDCSVDAVVTDPPYGLGFMGKEWDSGKSFVERKAAKGNTFDHVGGNHNPSNSADSARTRRSEARKFGEWCEQWAAECLRVLKPGGHILAFGGSRTWHRLASAIEDAGFEIRDSIAWLYGSGFPKSLDVSKAIDKAAGAERTVVGRMPVGWGGLHNNANLNDDGWAKVGTDYPEGQPITAPATPDAERWQGWGSAMKPGFEPVVVGRKPLIGTIAQNVLTYGTGALNIDATRIGPPLDSAGSSRGGNTSCTCPELADDRTSRTPSTSPLASSGAAPEGHSAPLASAPRGVTSCPQSQGFPGDCPSSPCSCGGRAQTAEADGRASAQPRRDVPEPPARQGVGTRNPASRSKPCPHCTAPNVERTATRAPAGRWPANVVLDESQADALDQQSGTRPGMSTQRDLKARGGTDGTTTYGKGIGALEPGVREGYNDTGGASRFFYVAKAPKSERPRTDDGTAHPTVKPLALMRWLVRLVTPPGGVVLEPFAGSGTTVEACILEGFQCVAIEREADYLPLIESRIARASQKLKPEPDLFSFDDEGASA
jgi:DNA modification methylase